MSTRSTSSRSTPTSGSRRASRSTSTTSTPPSRNSTPDTSPAKRPPTRTRGRSSRGPTPRFNRRELPATTPDWVNIDHRRVAAIAPGDLSRIHPCRVGRSTPDLNIYIEAVHRLSDLGAVVTHAANGTSQEGFDAEWRVIDILTVEGDLISRCELFDEARPRRRARPVRGTQPPTRRLENAASQVYERFSCALRGPRLGRDGGDTGRGRRPTTIVDEW